MWQCCMGIRCGYNPHRGNLIAPQHGNKSTSLFVATIVGMGKLAMLIAKITRPSAKALSIVLLAGLVTGCVGGTTYGTGTAHEKQTLDDIVNILSFRRGDQNIEYAARPDLVVPEEKKLVEPVEEASTTSESDWPESPEERIARLRAEAEEANENLLTRLQYEQERKGDGTEIEPFEGYNEAPPGTGVPNVSCDPDGKVMRQCTPVEISRAVRETREEIASVGKTGYKRRYLTEPPVEYRTPTDTAPTDDLGYTEAELKKIEEERKLQDRLDAKGQGIR